MYPEEAKEIYDYLNSYQEIKMDREDYENRMTGLKAITYSQEMPGGTATPATARMNKIMQRIMDLDEEAQEIEDFIDDEFKGVAKKYIWDHYIRGESFPDMASRIYVTVPGIRSAIFRAIKKVAARRTAQSEAK